MSRKLIIICGLIVLIALGIGLMRDVWIPPTESVPAKDAALPDATAAKNAKKPTTAQSAPAPEPIKNTPGKSAALPASAASTDIEAEKTDDEDSDPWEDAWASQRQYYQGIIENVDKLTQSLPLVFSQHSASINLPAQKLRRMFVLSEAYASKPRALEAVLYQIQTTSDDLRLSLEPAVKAHDNAQALLNQMQQIVARNTPENRQDAALSPQAKEFFRKLTLRIARLSKDLAKLESMLAPSVTLLDQADKYTDNISTQLPILWKAHYIAAPISYVDEINHESLNEKIQEAIKTSRLRMFMEIPQNEEDWSIAAARFIMMLGVLGILSFLGYRALLHYELGDTLKHIFYSSMPWIIVGCSFLAASIISRHQYAYNGLLNIGNIVLIIGQISLAWDLRRIHNTRAPKVSPLWPLCVPMLLGYELLYYDIPLVLLACAWMLVLIASLVWQYVRTRTTPPLDMEATLVRLNRTMLWLAMLLLFLGMPRYSILLYLIFVTIAVAIQLALGGMHLIHIISAKTSTSDIKNALASLLLSFAAPLILIGIIFGMTLWIVTLPGGYDLLHQYATADVHIAGTRFNMLHLLLIVCVFYVTRTIISIGMDFFAQLEKRDIRLDSTLIPPMQTAFKYTVWGLFGLFVLKSLGMELSNLAMVAGGLSVGIGFGMQAIVNNFLSGLILIFSRTLQEGDVIDVGGLHGTVRKISVRATTVETFDNAVIYVPNAEFVSSRLINWTRNSRSVRREIHVGVAYGTDTDTVLRLLRKCADSVPNILKYPQPTVLFSEFGTSTLNFSLRFWVADYDIAVGTASELRLLIEKTFRTHAVEVAFPQLDVHIKEKPRKRTARPAPTPATPRHRDKADAPHTLAHAEDHSRQHTQNHAARRFRARVRA